MKKIKGMLIFDGILVLSIIVLIILNTIYKNLDYILGFMCGFTLVAFIVTIIKYKHRDENYEYDERQLKARGECYKIAFFALIVMLLLDGFIRISLGYEWSSYIVGVLIMILISVAIFCSLAIMKDAYIASFQNYFRFGMLISFLGILNIILGVINGIESGFVLDGMVTECVLSLACGLILLFVGIISIIKNYLDNKEELIEE